MTTSCARQSERDGRGGGWYIAGRMWPRNGVWAAFWSLEGHCPPPPLLEWDITCHHAATLIPKLKHKPCSSEMDSIKWWVEAVKKQQALGWKVEALEKKLLKYKSQKLRVIGYSECLLWRSLEPQRSNFQFVTTIDSRENTPDTLSVYFGWGFFLYIIWSNPHTNPEKGKSVCSPG